MKALLPLLLLAGCGGPAPARWAHDSTDQPDYEDALRDWTRQRETYEHFESRVFARSTYFSPAFAAAHARYRAQRMGFDPATARKASGEAVAAAQREARFFLSLVTNDPYWNDLHQRDGTLRATLRVGDNAYPPLKVRRLSNDEMADVQPFFPYVDLLANGYWVVFPLPESRERIQLRVAGPPAVIDLLWETR